MAVPKKKMSRSRTKRRKAQWKLARPTVARCSTCNAAHAPHRACPTCGTYNGREIIEAS